MSKLKTAQLAKAIANLNADEQMRILTATDDDLPRVLAELGITLPSSSWLLIVLKIVLYGLGLVLAGVGTTAAAQTLSIM